MMKPDYSSISKDFNYYFGRQWRFKEFSPAQTDLRELEYRHLRSYSHAFNDSCDYTDLYEAKDNTRVLRLQVSVPTFDADDRVSNSWRCLYLFPGEKWAGTDGIYAAGGYQLAFAVKVHGLATFPEELEDLVLAPSTCTRKPKEIFEYREESSQITWKCQADENLSSITLLNLESAKTLGSSLKIPDTVDELPVEKIHSHLFDKVNHFREITLPSRVYKGEIRGFLFDSCRALENIWISEENKFYFSEDGVLYGTRKAIKDLVRYPPGRQARSYCIPEGTNRINDYGFSHCENLQEILIPDSVTSIGFEPFHCCGSLRNIMVSENNQNFFSRDGVLWEKGTAKPLWYPPGFPADDGH